MKHTMRIIICGLLFLILPLSAQSQNSIRCESHGGQYQHCRVRDGLGAYVKLTNKLSKSSCQQGISWGVDRAGIWVNKGCRAEFTIDRGYQNNNYQNNNYPNNNYQNNRHPNNTYQNNRYPNHNYPSNGYQNGNYPSVYDNNGYHSSGIGNQNRRNRRRLRHQKRIEAEKQEYQRRKKRRVMGSCPRNARIGRCSKQERARGCKDWKQPDQTPCKSGG